MIPTRIIVHCSASQNGKEYDIEQIRKDHIARGFSDVGYHIVIQCSGEAQKGRPLNQVGAHCLDENYDSIGICMVGLDKFTQKQFDVLRYQIDGIRMVYNIPSWNIFCHYQFPSAVKQGKTCPNIPINNLVAWYIAEDNKAIDPFLIKGNT